jgi:hypothetical protein
MNELRKLRHVFRAQLRARGLLAAATTLTLVFAFGIITADLKSWWFDIVPWLTDLSKWVKSQDSWDLFVYVFIGVAVFGYVQKIQSVLLDRYNGRILLQLSESEVEKVSASSRSVSKPAILLGARRRALEALFRSEPGMYSFLVLLVALAILGHPFSAVLLVAFGALLFLYFAPMTRRFVALKEPIEGEEGEPLEPLEAETELSQSQTQTAEATASQEADRELRLRARAQQRLSVSAERLFMLINRPLVRLRIGWPILVGALVTVAGVAAFTIHDMASWGQLPERGTLLVLLLVLTGRSCLTLAQHWEDLAFFASSLEIINESDTGKETF